MSLNNTGVPRSAYAPYPELVEPVRQDGPWTVENSNDQHWLPTNGATDKVARKIWTPYEPGAEGVALHEKAHVKWSPTKFPRVKFPIVFLQAVEDARINLGLRHVGLPFRLDREQAAHVAHLASRDTKEGQLATTIIRAVAALGTDAAPIMQEEIDSLPPRSAELANYWVRRTEERLSAARLRTGGPVALFRVAHQIAKEMAKDFKNRGMIDEDFENRGLGCCHVAGVEDPDGEEGFPSGHRLSRYERMLKGKRRDPRRGVVEAGHMKIARPPLVQRQPRVLRGGVSASRCRTEGARIVRPDRLLIDGAIFGGRGSGGGGTVLVDTSGSMSLSEKQVEEIVRAAGGAAVVAIYSGSGDSGELRIVADGDRRAASDQFTSFGAGNIVDLPALEWLARQPMPRLWISDMCVTGVGDQGCEKLLEACKAVVSRHRIERVDDAEEALEALA